MDYIFYAIMGLIVVWFFYNQFVGVKGLRELYNEHFINEWKEQSGGILIDVREPSEVKQGKVKGSVNIPLGQLASRISEIPKEKSVYLYCRSGMRSKQAAKILLRSGYNSVQHLRGGILSLKREDLQ
jgi:rhodanese-related sulfurtransferase